MPGGDGTGPQGRGSMTGRAAGYCSGSDMPGWSNLAVPRYRGRNGFSPMRGRGAPFSGRSFVPMPDYRGFPPAGMVAKQPKALVEEELAALETEKAWISERIEQLNSKLNENGSVNES